MGYWCFLPKEGQPLIKMGAKKSLLEGPERSLCKTVKVNMSKGAIGFGGFPSGFWSSLGQLFLYYVFFNSFGNRNVYPKSL